MAKYRLSSAADQDFELLFEYGIDNFGLAKAKSYIDGLTIQFQSRARIFWNEKVVAHPDLNRGPADYETQTERLPVVTLLTL